VVKIDLYMAVPKQHRSKSRQGQRRAHIYLKEPKFVKCKNCGEQILPHRVCFACGYYKNRKVLEFESSKK